MKNTMKKLLIVSSAIAAIMSSASAGGAPIPASNIAKGGSLVLDGATLELAAKSTVTNEGTIKAEGKANINVLGTITNTGIIDLSAITSDETNGKVTALNVTGTTSTLAALTAGANAPANAIILGKVSEGTIIQIEPEDITAGAISVSNNQIVQYAYSENGGTYSVLIPLEPGGDIDFTLSGNEAAGYDYENESSNQKVIAQPKANIIWHNVGEGVKAAEALTIDAVNTANGKYRTDVTLDLDTATGFDPKLTGGNTYVKLKNAATNGKGIAFSGTESTTYSFFGDNSGVKTAMDLPEANLVFGADNALFKHNDAKVKNITFSGTSSEHAENTLSATLTAGKLTVNQYADLANGGKNMVVEDIELAGTLTTSGGIVTLGVPAE